MVEVVLRVVIVPIIVVIRVVIHVKTHVMQNVHLPVETLVMVLALGNAQVIVKDVLDVRPPVQLHAKVVRDVQSNVKQD
mgnify:CR=1 FL=1